MDYTDGIIKNGEFFTTSELAAKLKMNVQVITRKVQAGEIDAYKIGKEWRIPERAVYEWLERNANGNGGGKVRTPAVSPKTSDKKAADKKPKVSKRKHLLEYMLAQFEPNRMYSETELNAIIKRYHHDYTTVRDEFIAEEMMELVDGKYRRRAGYRFSD